MKQFTSQIATSEEQSKRLLKLGLIPITADMYYWIDSYDVSYTHELNIIVNDEIEWGEEFIPAWSLSRLIELIPIPVNEYVLTLSTDNIEYSKINFCDSVDTLYFKEYDNLFDGIINAIDWLIKNNHFNKEYLNDGAQ